MATDSDRAYEEWLRTQLTQLQSQQTTVQPQRIHEPMPPYRTVEYTPPPTVAETTVTRSSPSIDWRTALGWTLVLGATAATFNIMLYSIRSVCPAPATRQAVVSPPPKPTKPRPSNPPQLLPVPTVPPPSTISPFNNGRPLSSFMPNSKKREP